MFGKALYLALACLPLAAASIPALTEGTLPDPPAVPDACYPYYNGTEGGEMGDYLGPGPSPGGVFASPTLFQ